MCSRVNPRISATATARPTAADTKFCTASPAICAKYPIVDSPEYHCQFVFVTKDTAVFHAPTAGTPGMPSAHGSSAWIRRMPYSRSTDAAENTSSDRAYTPHRWSARGSIPASR